MNNKVTTGCNDISQSIQPQNFNIDKKARSESLKQKPALIWFTGLSGAGKSTIANLLETWLHANGKHTYLLDGDNIRCGLSNDLAFTDADRIENIRRVAEVGKLFVDAGLITITSFISPFQADRDIARKLIKDDKFLEVFIDTPLAVAEKRDPKGLYKKARCGELRNFTGIDSPFEIPKLPDIHIHTEKSTAQEATYEIIVEMIKRGILKKEGLHNLPTW